MLNMSNAIKIKITSIIDPHEFYFKFLDEKWERVHELTKGKVADVERKIKGLRSAEIHQRDVRIGEIYGCFHERWGKWVRGRVIERWRNGDCRVFLIDHGFIRHFNKLIDIPRELRDISFNHIQRGSLPVKNNGNGFNQQWSDEALKTCRQLDSLKDQVTFNFIPIYKEQDRHVGDLFVFERDERYSVSERLIANGCVEKCAEPMEIFTTLLETRTELPVNCPKQRIELYSENMTLPKQLIVHGQRETTMWKSAADCQFSSVYRQNICKKFQSLTRMQSFIWPQIHAKRHAIMIAAYQDDLNAAYLVPLIAAILANPEHKVKPEHAGPIALIFASCNAKVEEVAQSCSEYASNLNIIKVVGSCEEKKFDLMSGCDLLIATPSALARLTSNISSSILYENRLKHVVFDNFRQLTSKFYQLISESLKLFLNIPSRQPQFIVTSDALTSALKSKLINRLTPQSETVVCFDDNHIEAASYAGMKFSIELVPKLDDVHEILLKKALDHGGKTVIAASDDKICNHLESQLTAKGVKFINCTSDAVAAKRWNAMNDAEHVLIISDYILERESVDIRSARNLIHFDLSSSERRFSRRFQVFRDAITERLDARGGSLTTSIYLHDENVDQFVRLMDFVTLQNLSNSFQDVLERIQMNRELIKCEQNVSVCNRLLQYGKCERASCPSRHVLSDRDKPMSHMPHSRRLIKFDLISVQNPTSFIIKIIEHFDNNKWVLRDETNKFIQRRLHEMQAFCRQQRSSLASNEGVIGGVYAKYDEKSGMWVRGRMIERVSDRAVRLYMLDSGTTAPAIEMKLLKLSEEYCKLYPLVCKLQVIDLVPLDMESQYDELHTQRLSEMIKRVDKRAFYMCKVEAVLCDTIFTKSFDARCNANPSHKFHLRNVHQKMKISEIEESVSQNLFKLFSTITTDEDNVEVMSAIKSTSSGITLKDETKKSVVPTTWKKLACGRTYSITLAHYSSPYSFFVTQENDENLTLKRGLEIIGESRPDDSLSTFEPGTICVYKDERVNRAIILSEEHVKGEFEILLVDYGEVRQVCKESLFKIPQECLSLDFQTIHCSMMGIRPKFNMSMWPALQRNAVEKLLRETALKMLVVNTDSRVTKFGMTCYQVLLYDRDSTKRLDKAAVDTKIADADETVNDLKLEFGSQEDMCEIEEKNLTVADDDAYSVYIEKDLMRGVEKLTGFSEPTETAWSSASTSSLPSFNRSESSTSSQPSSSILENLENLYRPPHIEWRQNEFMLYLLISARDSEEYSVAITEFSLDVIIKYAHSKHERTIIQLYGLIDVELCSHDMNGLNIVVRLVKRRCGHIWPRLSRDSEKSLFIKTSNEKVPVYERESSASSGDLSERDGRPPSDNEEIDTSDVEFKNLSSEEDF